MQRVIAALTTDKAGTIAALAEVVTELSEKARNVTGRNAGRTCR
jgi:hypothetical protein